ncbi:hypothetical protein QUB75_27160 [Microcoleus sp. K1-B6]|uniref:hypothetical protein n=1 Tax=unclassified Microcoleus TaxID=2642155 RepID=UPI002FD12345
MNDKKKAAAKEWIATILSNDENIPISELTYRLGGAIGPVSQNTVLEWLEEIKREKQAAIHLPNFDDDPYGYITPALDEDEEDDSGLSGEFEEEDDDGLPDPSDYEEDDHYVETFRDRRLDQ